MFTAALFTAAKRWEHPKCPPTDKWINAVWHVHAMDYDSALKRKGILPRETTQMDLEAIMLSEKSQPQKDKHRMIPLT